ncbi:hypothetical protein ACOME3_001772 [Neoechinorhynchus agilis]
MRAPNARDTGLLGFENPFKGKCLCMKMIIWCFVSCIDEVEAIPPDCLSLSTFHLYVSKNQNDANLDYVYSCYQKKKFNFAYERGFGTKSFYHNCIGSSRAYNR